MQLLTLMLDLGSVFRSRWTFHVKNFDHWEDYRNHSKTMHVERSLVSVTDKCFKRVILVLIWFECDPFRENHCEMGIMKLWIYLVFSGESPRSLVRIPLDLSFCGLQNYAVLICDFTCIFEILVKYSWKVRIWKTNVDGRIMMNNFSSIKPSDEQNGHEIRIESAWLL